MRNVLSSVLKTGWLMAFWFHGLTRDGVDWVSGAQTVYVTVCWEVWILESAISGTCSGNVCSQSKQSFIVVHFRSVMGQAKMLEEPTPAEFPPERLGAVRSHLQEVLSSDAFMGGHRAQSFLQLVVEHALAGRTDCLRERMLGAEMFGRPIDYDTGNDAVVRVKASEVRRRLAQYYLSLATPPPLQIELPAGSYAPQFHWAPIKVASTPVEPANSQIEGVSAQTQLGAGHSAGSMIVSRWMSKSWVFRAVLLAAYSAVLVSLTWFAVVRLSTPHRTPKAADPIWSAVFDGKRNTYIVPADVGLDLLEDLSHRPMALANYMKGAYLELPLEGVDAHSAEGLRSQRITSFVDAQIIATLTALPEYNPQRTFLRFPRDLRLDDLKDANAVLIGSVGSNPWAAIADSSANFHIVYGQEREGATIVNGTPQPGERASYESHWNDQAHETFALVAFLPNMSGNGHLLLLQGLDVAGTQAAAEMLFHSDAMGQIIQRAKLSDGSIRPIEILVRSTSINWNSTDSQVIASRIH
jgi:hypothetical protein